MNSFAEEAVPVERLLEELVARDIRLRVEGGDLRVSAPPGALSAELREVLRRRKAELMERLHSGAEVPLVPDTEIPVGTKQVGMVSMLMLSTYTLFPKPETPRKRTMLVPAGMG